MALRVWHDNRHSSAILMAAQLWGSRRHARTCIAAVAGTTNMGSSRLSGNTAAEEMVRRDMQAVTRLMKAFNAIASTAVPAAQRNTHRKPAVALTGRGANAATLLVALPAAHVAGFIVCGSMAM
jgi:hypothetical protein